MDKKQNLVYQTFQIVKRLEERIGHIEKDLQAQTYLFSDPFEFAKLYNKNDYAVLFYYQGKYYDRNSKSTLYELIKPTITKEAFLKRKANEELPNYLSQYKVSVAIAHKLASGDLITTLGHIISPQAYSIRHYRNSQGNYVKMVLDQQEIQIHLGETIANHFITNAQNIKVLYLDGDFTNNRIENLQVLEGT
jgi:hypothetical protein